MNLCLPIRILLFHYVADLTKCQKERRTALGPLGSAPPGRFAPECDDNGKYNKMQCYSATNYCWCVDSLGLEIPGTRKKGMVSCPDKGLLLLLFSYRSVQKERRRNEETFLTAMFKTTYTVFLFSSHESHCRNKINGVQV